MNWRNPVYELDPSDPENNGFINEDFIVWMRTAALPTFRKLYRIIQKKPNTTPTLPSGKYLLTITYSILYESNYSAKFPDVLVNHFLKRESKCKFVCHG